MDNKFLSHDNRPIESLNELWTRKNLKKGAESTTDEERSGEVNDSLDCSFDFGYESLNLEQDSSSSLGPKQYSILICTDFAFPKFGGVETHGYQLAQCLIERGHKVIFVSNKF
jgi:hypothetical protein